jgi:tetratricopeptide (TPR) repeat protein
MRWTFGWVILLLLAVWSLHFRPTSAFFKLKSSAQTVPSKSAATLSCNPAAVTHQTGRKSDSTLLSSVRSSSSDGVIRFFQWRVSLDPTSYFDYDRLGTAYMQKARETGDITYYQLAEKALEKSLVLESSHPEAASATAHIADVYFAEHRFSDAIRWARRALSFKTGDVSEFATIGDCMMNLGDYAGARVAYSNLVPSISRPYMGPGLTYLRESRFAALDFAEGRSLQSIVRMDHAIAAARSAGMRAENIAWTEYMLGFEYFRVGQIAKAENSYNASLKDYPGYHRSLAGLAELRASQGHFDESIRLYQQAISVIPMPVYVAELSDVYAKTGRTEDAKKAYELVEYIARLSALSQSVFNRELALFYADHDLKVDEAVTLAHNELAAREDVYTWDALAFALYKKGQDQEAAVADVNALRLGTQDPLLFFHAGMIAHARGDDRRARQYLQRALALNPHFHIFYADQARQVLDSIGSQPTELSRRDYVREPADRHQ